MCSDYSIATAEVSSFTASFQTHTLSYARVPSRHYRKTSKAFDPIS